MRKIKLLFCSSVLLILILLTMAGELQVARAQTAVLDKFVYLPLVKRSSDLVAGIPSSRRMAWNPGIPGGIPHRTTICATADAAAYGNDSTDATAYLQGLIDNCPAGQVVYLPAGTYRIADTLRLDRAITLRGAGPGISRIHAATDTRAFLMASWNDWLYNDGGTSLTVDAPRGSTQITVASTAGITAPGFILIDQVDDAQVWRYDCWYLKRQTSSNPDQINRSIGQIAEVVAINGNTLTLADPLNWSYTTALAAQVVRTELTRDIGMEDLTVIGVSGIYMWAAYSWIKNVESDTLDEGGIHIELNGCYRCVVRDSYVHHSHNYNAGGNAYGIAVNAHTTNSLVENDIAYYLNKAILADVTGGGNVVGYNYIDDGISGQAPTWMDFNLDAVHCSTPVFDLYEGNWAPKFGAANTHGNGLYLTFYRNYGSSRNRTLGATQDGNIAAFEMEAYHRYFNLVGNVLWENGRSGNLEANGDTYDNCVTPAVFRIGGFSNEDMCDFSDRANTNASLLRHGNFDYFTNSTTWDPNVSDHYLPASLYLTSKPAFFGANRWPWIGPDLNPMVGTLPAKQRFDSLSSFNPAP
jgi:hypothetical protein